MEVWILWCRSTSVLLQSKGCATKVPPPCIAADFRSYLEKLKYLLNCPVAWRLLYNTSGWSLLPIKMVCSWHLSSSQREQMMDHFPIPKTLFCTVKMVPYLLSSFSFPDDFQPFHFAAPNKFPVNILPLSWYLEYCFWKVLFFLVTFWLLRMCPQTLAQLRTTTCETNFLGVKVMDPFIWNNCPTILPA